MLEVKLISTEDLLSELDTRFDTLIFAGRQHKYSAQIPLREMLHYSGSYSDANMLVDQMKARVMCDYQRQTFDCGDG